MSEIVYIGCLIAGALSVGGIFIVFTGIAINRIGDQS